MRTWVAQLRKGLVELCVMGTLRGGEAYGYEILQRLAGRADHLAVTESTVYPILARLAKEGLLQVRAAPSPHGPARRYYRLTPSGAQRLAQMDRHWCGLRDAVNRIVHGDPT